MSLNVTDQQVEAWKAELKKLDAEHTAGRQRMHEIEKLLKAVEALKAAEAAPKE